MKRVIKTKSTPLLTRLRNSGFTIKELYKMFEQDTGLEVAEDTREEFKHWCEDFLSSITANTDICQYKGYSVGMQDNPPQKYYFIDDKGHTHTGESEEHVKSMIDSYLEHGKVYAANYGGAYDVDPEQFFTKEDIVEFADSLAQALNMDGDYPNGSEWKLSDVYMETPNTLVVELESPFESVEVVKEKIDMRKIKKPTDVFKYMTSFEKKFLDQVEELQ